MSSLLFFPFSLGYGLVRDLNSLEKCFSAKFVTSTFYSFVLHGILIHSTLTRVETGEKKSNLTRDDEDVTTRATLSLRVTSFVDTRALCTICKSIMKCGTTTTSYLKFLYVMNEHVTFCTMHG